MLLSPQILVRTKPAIIVAGGGSPAFTAGASIPCIANGFAGGTITFTGLNGGVNFPANSAVYVVIGQNQNGTALVSPQIGGSAATLITGSQDSSLRCQMYYLAVGGSSVPDTFSFTNGNGIDRAGLASCYVTNVTAAPSASSNETFGANTDPQTPSAAITVPATGFGIAGFFAANVGLTGTNAVTWTNTTVAGGDVNNGPTNAAQVGLAHTATPGSWTPTVSGNTIAFAFFAAMSTIAVGP